MSDRVREGLFSSLGGSVDGARVLDLYAGTGAEGIEALSRGAESAVFVDRSRAAVRTIHDNLRRTHLEGRATVRNMDVLRFLRGSMGPFDLVLADPPYDLPEARVAEALTLLQTRLSHEGWTVALTRPKGNSIDVIPVNWRVARRLEYGDSLVVLYREV
jgi:16S rRNA (guanine966-N2)-methyltransferase